jgi:hypothetical protein
MTAQRKRWRTPVAKPGEIKIVYGKAERYDAPDLCVAWGTGADMKCTGSLMMHVLTEKRLRHKFPTGGTEYVPSLIEELEARGFDITTLRITIQRKDCSL